MKIFTGQTVIGTDDFDRPHRTYDMVQCPCCKEPVSLRIGYIDKYEPGRIGQETYVHFRCLSAERKAEMLREQ